MALKRLRLELAISIRCPIDVSAERPYEASALWVGRCRGGRIVASPSHDDFPALLAEALDVLRASEFDPKVAAGALGCSPSQLIKLVKEVPRALEWINEERRQNGQHSLK
jgi:hypothetical protein